MKRLHQVRSGGWISRRVRFATAVGGFTLAVVLLGFTTWAAGTVATCTESALRAALAGGGTVTFACDGTITLAGTITVTEDTRLDGNGHQITISGGNAVRVFYVAWNAHFTALSLTIANGQSTDGAGVFTDGGTLALVGATFLSNIATNGGVPGTNVASCGGAICNRRGSVVVSNCVFSGNRAFGSPSDSFYSSGFFGVAGGDGCGAAIYSAGQLSVESSTFVDNLVQGGIGDIGLSSASLSDPSSAGAGGSGNGGAIFVLGAASVSGSTFVRNVAVGGAGGSGGMGAFGMIGGGIGGFGGAGGSANGAVLFIDGSVSLVNCTITSNTAAGAAGGGGGMGGFGLFGGSGGNGGAGGAGFGGIYDPGGLLAITNSTIALNAAQGGLGGSGGGGGFGVYGNGGWGVSGINGIAAGGVKTAGGKLLNTLLAANVPTNCSGIVTDLGHNLTSDGSCNFTNIGSLNNTDPKLGPLANNGGSTLTMVLRPGSPAINAGDPNGAPPIDQRGVARPQGPGVDMGAFEYQYVPAFTDAKFQDPGHFWLQMSGLLPTQAFTLQASTNLVNWFDLTHLVAGDALLYEFVDGNLSHGTMRFYRLKVSTP